MKKYITIEIGGRNFICEESIATQLSNYLDDLRTQYNCSSDANEIMQDLEMRISDLFSEYLLRDKRAELSQHDIDEVIVVIGNPQDMASFDSNSKNRKKSSNSTTIKRKFYRNPDDKILAGIGSGLALFFNIDTLLMRILIVICTLFFGVTILVYILLWIFIPEAKTVEEKHKMRGGSCL